MPAIKPLKWTELGPSVTLPVSCRPSLKMMMSCAGFSSALAAALSCGSPYAGVLTPTQPATANRADAARTFQVDDFIVVSSAGRCAVIHSKGRLPTGHEDARTSPCSHLRPGFKDTTPARAAEHALNPL